MASVGEPECGGCAPVGLSNDHAAASGIALTARNPCANMPRSTKAPNSNLTSSVGQVASRCNSRAGLHYVKTNDLASIDADDFLCIQGRADDAINCRGLKTPPARIADALRKHPGMPDATIIGIPDARLGQVTATVESTTSAAPTEQEHAKFVRGGLIARQVTAKCSARVQVQFWAAPGDGGVKRVSTCSRKSLHLRSGHGADTAATEGI